MVLAAIDSSYRCFNEVRPMSSGIAAVAGAFANAEDGKSPAIESLMGKARDASDFLKALAHENRLLLLCLLSERERSVGELETILALRQPTVSQQLARLRLEGLVTTRRDGKTIYYSLASDDVRRVIGVVYDIFCGAPEPAGR
jgi:DNA-binding transcriptional ArsR family regulator